MSLLLLKYRPFLIVYFIFGLCPFVVCTKTGLAHTTKLSFIYNVAFFSVTFLLFSKFNVDANANTFFKTPVDFHQIIGSGQSLISMFVYGIVVVNFLLKTKEHLRLLNGIALLDIKTDQHIADGHLIIIDSATNSSLYVRHFTMALSSTIMFIVLLIITPVTDEFLVGLYFLQCLTLLSKYLMAYHICGCAVMLHQRFQLLFKCLEVTCCCCSSTIRENRRLLADTLMLLEQYFRLKVQFEKVFGFAMFLFIAVDLMLLSATLYMYIFFSIMRNWLPFKIQLYMIVAYMVWPQLKNAIMIVVIDGFGDKVSKF